MLEEMTLCEEVFHTAGGVAYADFITDDHRETWPIRSKRFRTWLRRCYYHATGAAAGATVIGSALDLLEARAQFNAPERAVSIRVAEHAGRLYLDLADEHWRAVEIGADGWRVIECPPVRFRRVAGMLPLPVPEGGGSIDALQSFLNLSNQNDFVLVVAWLLATLRSSGPYPLLAISGEQGSAKTVLSKLLRALIDPNAAPVRALPREERELMIAANNGHLLAFDNLSGLPPWLSDALCRLASGGSFAVRQLYTDDEEVLFKAARPTLLNGIEDIIGRSDLADRAIFLTLAPIGEEQRRSETELWREFELARPRSSGVLLDAAAQGLRAVGSVHLDRLPRMADFALWATACETALWPAGTFTRAYAANRKTAIEGIIDADPIAACVRDFMSEPAPGRVALPTFCRPALNAGQTSDSIGWPKNPRALAGHLRRAQTFLRALGIDIAFSREGRAGSRVIRMRTSVENTVSTVSSVSSVAMAGPNPGSEQQSSANPVCDDKYQPGVPNPAKCPVRLQTMLTVLTKSHLSFSGDWDESYWRGHCRPNSRRRLKPLLRRSTGAFEAAIIAVTRPEPPWIASCCSDLLCYCDGYVLRPPLRPIPCKFKPSHKSHRELRAATPAFWRVTQPVA